VVLLLSALLLAAPACTPVLKAPVVSASAVSEEGRRQKELFLELFQARRQRLARVASRLRVQGVELCGEQVGPYYGVLVRSRDDIAENFRDAATTVLGLGKRPTIELIEPGSPAETAGLETGWVVDSINGHAVHDGEDVARFTEEARAAGAALKLELGGDQAGRRVTVEPVTACAFPVHMQVGDSVNAFADGRRVVIFSGMIKFVESDEELALVVGHEMAHNVLSHVHKQQGNYVVGRLLGLLVDIGAAAAGVNTAGTGEMMGASIGANASSLGFESEADYMGMYVAARAGYDVSGAPMLWRRMAVEHPGSIDGAFMASHPSTTERFVALEQTVDEIKRRRAAGEELIPLRLKE
jgi:hypothetical protein